MQMFSNGSSTNCSVNANVKLGESAFDEWCVTYMDFSSAALNDPTYSIFVRLDLINGCEASSEYSMDVAVVKCFNTLADAQAWAADILGE
jgi:hypothetical protein